MKRHKRVPLVLMIHLKRVLFISHRQKKKGFRRKKGESPFEIQTDIKIKNEKKQSNYANPDAWGRLIGRTIQPQSIWKVIWLLAFWILALNCQ